MVEALNQYWADKAAGTDVEPRFLPLLGERAASKDLERGCAPAVELHQLDAVRLDRDKPVVLSEVPGESAASLGGRRGNPVAVRPYAHVVNRRWSAALFAKGEVNDVEL